MLCLRFHVVLKVVCQVLAVSASRIVMATALAGVGSETLRTPGGLVGVLLVRYHLLVALIANLIRAQNPKKQKRYVTQQPRYVYVQWFPKMKGPQCRPHIVGHFLQGHPQKGRPIYRNSQIHSSKLTWKWRGALNKFTILYIGPFMSFYVNLGEGMTLILVSLQLLGGLRPFLTAMSTPNCESPCHLGFGQINIRILQNKISGIPINNTGPWNQNMRS